jgi:hypothetical protein
MKHLRNTDITPTSQLPIKSGTLEFLQDAHEETSHDIIQAIVKNIIGESNYSLSTPYVLYGLTNVGSGSSYIISNGAILYGGQIYRVDTATFTAGAGQTAIMNFVTSQYNTNADPVTFSDAVQRNVHDIIKIVVVAGTSGSGSVADYSTLVFPFKSDNWVTDSNTSNWTVSNGTVTAVIVKYKIYKKQITLLFEVAFNITGACYSLIYHGFPSVNRTGLGQYSAPITQYGNGIGIATATSSTNANIAIGYDAAGGNYIVANNQLATGSLTFDIL